MKINGLMMYFLALFFFFILIRSECRVMNPSRFKMWSALNYQEISKVMKDLALALPTQRMILVLDIKVEDEFYKHTAELFSKTGFIFSLYVVKSGAGLNMVVADIKSYLMKYDEAVYFILMRHHLMEEMISLINKEDLIRRNIVYFFFWIKKSTPSMVFQDQVLEAARICVVVNSKPGLYKIFYNQATSDGMASLKLVNWWSLENRLFRHPLLPEIKDVYKNFHRRVFEVPVLHKPPWNFVIYHNDSIEVVGGRDDKLLTLLAIKFNFRYKYIDPPDRSQGSTIINGNLTGVLGLIWQRCILRGSSYTEDIVHDHKEVHMFVGDLALTYERNQAVEFTFPTLADSEVFLTHSPGRLSEALALVRPFQAEVWLLVLLTVFASGPLLFIIIEMPMLWNRSYRRKSSPSHYENFCNCIWVTFTIFLQQSVNFPSSSCRFRLVVVILILSAVYVIGDMYSANLTSILAHPSKEQPISTLTQLAEAMKYKEFQLLVERQSSSHALLENGTGIYSVMWKLMQKQSLSLLDSNEQGMKFVKERKNYALIGGRETFSYDTRRFGPQHFHMSEKLNTKYSAIAVQLGCPFLKLFNKQIMMLYEAGILNKITEEEYQKLGETRAEDAATVTEGESANIGASKTRQEDETMAMSVTTLQGSFFVMIVGHLIATFTLLMEMLYERYCSWVQKKARIKFFPIKQLKRPKKPEYILNPHGFFH